MHFQAWTLNELLHYLGKIKEKHGGTVAVGTMLIDKLTYVNMELIVVDREKEFFLREYKDGDVLSKTEKLGVKLS